MDEAFSEDHQLLKGFPQILFFLLCIEDIHVSYWRLTWTQVEGRCGVEAQMGVHNSRVDVHIASLAVQIKALGN
jgi:hypothetical protein